MRLIDANALIEDFKGRIEPCDKWIKETSEEIKPRAEATRAFINEVILTIQYAPTIEPDRPHGEWLPTDEMGYMVRCSECNFVTHDDVSEEYKFCQNCGADMRKEGDKE